jgi:hypothetical protein
VLYCAVCCVENVALTSSPRLPSPPLASPRISSKSETHRMTAEWNRQTKSSFAPRSVHSMCVTCDIPCYIRKRFYDVCVLYVCCVRYNVLTPPPPLPSRPGPCVLCVLRVIYRATYVNGFTMCVCALYVLTPPSPFTPRSLAHSTC